jgi:phosphohistidine swiveling domain-containing protein
MTRQYNMPEWVPWEQNASPMLLTMTLNAGMRELRDHFGTSLWTSVIFFEHGQAQWMFRPKELKALGQKMIDYLLCPAYRVAFETGYETTERDLLEAAGRLQARTDLHQLSNRDLVPLFDEQCERYYAWYKFGWFCEPVQFQGQDVLVAYFQRHPDSLPAGTDATVAAKQLLAVDEPSFASGIQQHSLECARALERVLKAEPLRTQLQRLPKDERFPADAATILLSGDLRSDPISELRTLVTEHAKRFHWKLNNYFATRMISARDVLEELLGAPTFDMDRPSAALTAAVDVTRKNRNSAQLQKRALLAVLPDYERDVCLLASRVGGSLIDRRKRTIMIANAAFDRMLLEVANRTGRDIADCRQLIPQELSFFLNSPNDYAQRIQERNEFFLVYQGDMSVLDEMIAGIPLNDVPEGLDFEAVHMADPYIAEGDVAREAIPRLDSRLGFLAGERTGQTSTIRGVTAYADPRIPVVEGVVRVIRNPANEHLQRGEVLVAPSTTPDYTEAITRCAAIVTDWGGFTSHAAIISRELGKPCIIGTTYASHVLKTGTRVRLDFAQATVRILE